MEIEPTFDSIKLLFVDDEEALRITMPAILRQEGFEVTTAASVAEALQLISSQPFHALLSDLNIGQPGDGFTVVSAMRRTQPDAVTFIITGYPDFDTALTAIRSQVDDYVVKPADMQQLSAALKSKLANKLKRQAFQTRPPYELLRQNLDLIVQSWLAEVKDNPELARKRLTDSERTDHVPELLREIIRALEMNDIAVSEGALAAAEKHGRIRSAQGYTAPQIASESRILQRVIANFLHSHLLGLDISQVIPSLILINENLNAQLEASLRSFTESATIA